jgi:cbb3-type cytochrome oxidase subunit 3
LTHCAGPSGALRAGLVAAGDGAGAGTADGPVRGAGVVLGAGAGPGVPQAASHTARPSDARPVAVRRAGEGPARRVMSVARPTPHARQRHNSAMALLLIEALLALALLLFIVWWTMFSGRRKGELQDATADENPAQVAEPATGHPPPAGAPSPSTLDGQPAGRRQQE